MNVNSAVFVPQAQQATQSPPLQMPMPLGRFPHEINANANVVGASTAIPPPPPPPPITQTTTNNMRSALLPLPIYGDNERRGKRPISFEQWSHMSQMRFYQQQQQHKQQQIAFFSPEQHQTFYNIQQYQYRYQLQQFTQLQQYKQEWQQQQYFMQNAQQNNDATRTEIETTLEKTNEEQRQHCKRQPITTNDNGKKFKLQNQATTNINWKSGQKVQALPKQQKRAVNICSRNLDNTIVLKSKYSYV